MRTLRVLPHQDISARNSAAAACAGAHRWQLAALLLAQGGPSGTDVVTFNTCITACERAARWEQGLELLCGLVRRRLRPSVVTLSAAVSACQRGHAWELGLLILARMRAQGPQPNAVTFNAAASAAAAAGRWEAALSLLQEMVADAHSPDVVSFTVGVAACGRALRWAEGLRLLSQSLSHDVVPDPVTLHAALSACEGLGRPAEAAAVSARLRRSLLRETLPLLGPGASSGQRLRAASLAVAAYETLSPKRALAEESCTKGGGHVMPSLRQLLAVRRSTDEGGEGWSHHERWRLRDAALEQQPSLGVPLTARALMELKLAGGRRSWSLSWLKREAG
ncbi:unnamed protein product [Polarella glacialis]|uniref:Pentatricopeptide repeat-containing protein, chloroplastic n=1 Tax=Polarella glacialis TaxID=89957 RepID=A0A813DFL0_POLGL|nr:unnamed protein product [Polarella glacialis]